MRAFSYARNPVDSSKDCQRLVDAILSHPNISSCDFESLLRGERNGHDYLVDLLRKEGMGGITFDNCGVNTGGQSTLFDIIKLHPNLVRLSLDKNKLNDKDAIHIADALRYNRTLEKLSLNENEFTSLGEDVMMKVICDDSSLNAAAGSNHVCVIKGLTFLRRQVTFGVSTMTQPVAVIKMSPNKIEHERFLVFSRKETRRVQMPTTWRQKWVEETH